MGNNPWQESSKKLEVEKEQSERKKVVKRREKIR